MAKKKIEKKVKEKLQEGTVEVKPATELMKKVAAATLDREKMEKDFTPEEIKEIMARRVKQEEISKADSQKLSKMTRTNKKWVRLHAAGDYGRLFFYPSYTAKNGEIWYKTLDFSALYFVYNLAERIGMNVNIYDDKDAYVKATYTASVRDIEKVAIKFMELGGKNVEITTTGVYILTLQQPMSADYYSDLMCMEEERRDRVNNLLKPAAMQPITHKMLLDVVRQLGPKIRRLEKRDFFSLGQNMISELEDLFKLYYLYSDGLIDKKTTGLKLMATLNKLKAGLAILQELGAWENVAIPAMLGESLMRLREQIIKDFNVKLGS